ncbi:MAG: hypothetical protein QM500_05675 [Methylococcales bacterium]
MKIKTIKKVSNLISKSSSYIWDKISKDSRIVKVSVPHNPNMTKNGLLEAERSMSKLAHKLNKDENFNIRYFEVQGKTSNNWDAFKAIVKRTKNKIKISIIYSHETNITAKEIEMIIRFKAEYTFEKSDLLRLKHEEFNSKIYMDVLDELFYVQKQLHGRFVTYESDKNFLPKATT